MVKGGNTVVRNLLNISISLLLIGILFKIQHYAYAGELIFTGYGAIFILYPIRFYHKQPKVLLDYLKVGLVLSFIIFLKKILLKVDHYTKIKIFHNEK